MISNIVETYFYQEETSDRTRLMEGGHICQQEWEDTKRGKELSVLLEFPQPGTAAASGRNVFRVTWTFINCKCIKKRTNCVKCGGFYWTRSFGSIQQQELPLLTPYWFFIQTYSAMIWPQFAAYGWTAVLLRADALNINQLKMFHHFILLS